MESALNLVWLSVSVALLIVCGAHVARAGEDRRRGMAAVALVCLICLLFPVISMTDDLNSSPALVEPSKAKKLMPSVLMVVTLLPWPSLRAPQESSWVALGRQPDVRRPLQDVFAFHLNRRPPPPRPSLALS